MDRRSFVKNGALFAAGALIPSTGWGDSLKGPLQRVGVIGCGDRGKGLLAVLSRMPDKFKVVSYCDVLEFRLKETKSYVPADAVAMTNYRSMLDQASLDAVFIATPLNAHFQMAKEALQANKHVYLEKTMTYHIEEALALRRLVQQNTSRIFQVGYQYRYSPLYFKVKEMIQSGYLGKVSQVDCRWDRNGNWRRSVPDASLERQVNWRMYKAFSGGLAAELLSHQIDFINWAFETQPEEVIGFGGIDIFKDGRETHDNIQNVLRYQSAGMIGNFGATCGNAHDGYLFKIKGTKGAVSLLTNTGFFYPEKERAKELGLVDGVTGATKISPQSDGGIPILDQPTKDGTIYALEAFYQSIVENKPPVSNIETGTKASICVSMCNRAIDTGTSQFWMPAYN